MSTASIVQQFKDLPAVKVLRQARYERLFRKAGGYQGLHRGVYPSFAEARRSSPVRLDDVYEMDDQAWVAKTLDRVAYYDYPILFWLRPAPAGVRMVFDLGGHVGVHRAGYSRYLELPGQLRWLVCEQPQVVALGEKLLREGRVSGVEFTTSAADGDGAEIFLSAGTLQFIETHCWALLAGWKHLPQHLLLNKVPLRDAPTAVTLQNTGSAFVPCWLYDRREFIASFERLGYELVDSWLCPDRGVHVPFHLADSVVAMSGLYLRRKA